MWVNILEIFDDDSTSFRGRESGSVEPSQRVTKYQGVPIFRAPKKVLSKHLRATRRPCPIAFTCHSYRRNTYVLSIYYSLLVVPPKFDMSIS